MPSSASRVSVFAFCVLVLLGSSSAAFGYVVTIDITAQVRFVQDSGDFLGGAVQAGDMVVGRYVYESTTLDSGSLPTVGHYWHDAEAYGMSLSVNGLNFRTNPADVNFLIELCNDHGSGLPMDHFLLRSYNNLFDVSVPELWYLDNHICWQLDDESCGALSSTDLPIGPPILSDWPDDQTFGLDIWSQNGLDQFLIRSDVLTATLVPPSPPVPEPSSLLLLAVGLGGGLAAGAARRRRGR